MPLSGAARAQAVYQLVLSQGGQASLTAAEKQKILAQLQAFYGADTQYLTANATITPDSLNNPAGQPVQVAIPAGTGTTTVPQPLAGTGRLT